MANRRTYPWKPVPKTQLAEELIGEELFVSDGDAVHCLNSGAALVWLLCDGQHDVGTIARKISVDFDLPLGQIQAEVAATIAQFANLGLLESDNANDRHTPAASTTRTAHDGIP